MYFLLSTAFPQANLTQQWSEPKGVWDPVEDRSAFADRTSNAGEVDDEKDSKLSDGAAVTTDVLPAVESRY